MQLLKAGRNNVVGLAFTANGEAMVACCRSAVPLWWDLPAVGEPIPLTDKPVYSCSSFTFSPDAPVLGWLSEQQRLEHDRRSGTTRTVALCPEGEVLTAQALCGPDGWLVVSTRELRAGFRKRGFRPDGSGAWVPVWQIDPTDTGWHLAGTRGSERFFAWETNYRRGMKSRIIVCSSRTGESIVETAPPTNRADGFCIKPDGSALVAFRDSSLYFWEPGEKVKKVRTGTLRHYRSLAFHPDGRHLLAGNNDTTARLIDTTTWQVVRQYTWAIGRLFVVAISPNGQLAAAGGTRGQIVIWDLDL